MKLEDYPVSELKLENLIKERDLAKLLGVSRAFLYTLRKERGLPFIRLGKGKIYYFIPQAVRWMLNPVPKAENVS